MQHYPLRSHTPVSAPIARFCQRFFHAFHASERPNSLLTHRRAVAARSSKCDPQAEAGSCPSSCTMWESGAGRRLGRRGPAVIRPFLQESVAVDSGGTAAPHLYTAYIILSHIPGAARTPRPSITQVVGRLTSARSRPLLVPQVSTDQGIWEAGDPADQIGLLRMTHSRAARAARGRHPTTYGMRPHRESRSTTHGRYPLLSRLWVQHGR